MKKIKCLFFDDQLGDPSEPLEAFPLLLRREFVKMGYLDPINEVSTVPSAEEDLNNCKFDLVFLDIRISPNKGGGIGEYRWERTGIALTERIRSGYYEKEGTSHDVPIIVITAVADSQALDEIKRIGQGEPERFLLEVFEKPVSANVVASKAFEFLKNRI